MRQTNLIMMERENVYMEGFLPRVHELMSMIGSSVAVIEDITLTHNTTNYCCLTTPQCTLEVFNDGAGREFIECTAGQCGDEEAVFDSALFDMECAYC